MKNCIFYDARFNHKTGAEDVHFTSVSSHCDSDNDSDESSGYDENANDSDRDLQSQNIGDNPAVLQMIIVKDVKAGAEVSTFPCSKHFYKSTSKLCLIWLVHVEFFFLA